MPSKGQICINEGNAKWLYVRRSPPLQPLKSSPAATLATSEHTPEIDQACIPCIFSPLTPPNSHMFGDALPCIEHSQVLEHALAPLVRYSADKRC